MTVRERIAKSAKVFMRIGFAAWLVLAITMAIGGARGGEPFIPVMVGGAAVFFAAVLGLMFFVECPCCGYKFGIDSAKLLHRRFFQSWRINFCPHCGVNLDDPL